MRVVLIPGWNEGADGIQVFAKGRHGIPGLAALGFECAVFDGGRGSLRDRIDQLAQFLAGLRSSRSGDEAPALFGYSAGALTARGLLRAYPKTAVAAIFQLAAPNAGVVVDDAPWLLHRIHFDRDVLEDLDIESEFMSWLNQTGGHWELESKSRRKRWKLEKKPWTVPENVPISNLAGRMQRYHNQSDGIVRVESASLDGHLPCDFIDGKNANHLNVGGTWNALTLVLRGWRSDDVCWPQAVAAAAQLFRRSAQRRKQ
jgi:pimeloyl-ACP methyl ester carboxylesterase